MPARYAALIPLYNVSKACIPVLTKTAPQVDICLAIDDGSTDDTARYLEELRIQNLRILRHSVNQGKGAALLNGFRFLLSDPSIDAVLTLDGDGQHDPAHIGAFQAMFDRERVDLIYGNRMSESFRIPLARRWLNRLSNRIMSAVCRQDIRDSQCGFRLHSALLLQSLLPELQTGRYELETEILIKACRKNFKVAMVPISTLYSPESRVLSHHSLFDVVRITRVMLAYYFRKPQS